MDPSVVRGRVRGIVSQSGEYHLFLFLFFFNYTATTEIYTLSLHDALPIQCRQALEFGYRMVQATSSPATPVSTNAQRSEEHTSELQSRSDLVCRLLLE